MAVSMGSVSSHQNVCTVDRVYGDKASTEKFAVHDCALYSVFKCCASSVCVISVMIKNDFKVCVLSLLPSFASRLFRTVVNETYVGNRRERPTKAKRGMMMEVRSSPPSSS